MGTGRQTPPGETLLETVFRTTPEGPTKTGLEMARRLSLENDPRTAASALGAGYRVCAFDTVPFTVWCAARHLDHYENALWTAVAGLGDRDTTCAVVGGIVALSAGRGPFQWQGSKYASRLPWMRHQDHQHTNDRRVFSWQLSLNS